MDGHPRRRRKTHPLFFSIARHCGCWCDETAIGVMHVAVRRHALRGRLFSRRLETKSLADITAAVLQEGSSVVAKPGTIPGPSLETLQELTKAMPPQPVSVLMLSSWAKITKGNDAKALQGRLMQARFVRSELIARRAHILSLLHSMPEPLAGQPAVVRDQVRLQRAPRLTLPPGSRPASLPGVRGCTVVVARPVAVAV